MIHEKYGNVLEIWQPRYMDNKVLVATHKVNKGKNYLTFTKDNNLRGIIFEFLGEDIIKYPTQSNGRGYVYVYPMHLLKRVDGV